MLSLLGFLRKLLNGNRPYVLALVVLNLFFFSDVLLTENTFFYRDIGNFHQPLKKLVTEAYGRGEWPLWNPYLQFGQPLLANPNAMALYPTQLLFQILPFEFAFDLNLVIHCLIGGLGLFYLCRALSLSPLASLAAAIAYNFNGVVLSLINLPLLAAIAGLLPWLALLLWNIVRRPSLANLAVSSLMFGFLLLLLEPLTTYAIFLFLAPFGLYSFCTRPVGVSARKVVCGLLIVLVSAFCLAAIQILPTLELLQNSGREKGLPMASVFYWSVHPLSLTQMLFPHVWRDVFDLTGNQSRWWTTFFETREAYVISCYAGLSCLMIALLALFFSERRRLKWVLLSVTLIAVLLAMGKYTPIYPFLFRYLSPFRLGRYPAKYLLATAICLSLLTGLGIEQLKRLGSSLSGSFRRRRLALYVALVAGLLIGSGLLGSEWLWRRAGFNVADNALRLPYPGQTIDVSLSLLRYSILYLWMVVAGSLLLIFFSARRKEGRVTWIAVAATALIFFDLLANHGVNPLARRDVYDRSPVTQWLVAHTPMDRMARVYHVPDRESPYVILGKTDSFIWNFLFRRLTAAPYTAVGDHVQYSSFVPIDRLETRTSQLINARLQETKDFGKKLEYLAHLNTGYVLSMNPLNTPLLEPQISFDLNADRWLRIYRLKSATPRAYLAELREIESANTGQGAYPLPIQNPSIARSVEITRYRAGEVELTANALKPSLLVVLDSYYPGWGVWVDGREQKVQEVNRAFRGVVLGAGRHEVTFRYVPNSFRYGGTITLITMLAWAAAFVFLSVRRRKAAKRQGERAIEAAEPIRR